MRLVKCGNDEMLKESFLSNEYFVSDDGYILSKNKKHKLHGSLNHSGYVIVTLMIKGKRISISEHTLVARAFCKGYKEGLQVNHINGIKTDNRACNLEWVTAKENMQHSVNVLGEHKGIKNVNHKEIDVYDYKTKKFISHYDCISDLCRYFEQIYNIDFKSAKTNIYKVTHGLRKSYHGYTFKIL